MNLRLLTISFPLVVIGLLALGAVEPGSVPSRSSVSAVGAPQLLAPGEGEIISSFGPTLRWVNPQGTTQYQLQVAPVNNDGPGVDLHIGAADASFSIQAPPLWYGLLPDLTYTWRLRVSDAAGFMSLTDASWSAWAEGHFRTPKVSSATISTATVTTLTPTLVWFDSRTDVFYYEVQVSKDPTFNTDPATATAMVYWELRHSGVTNPPYSYTIPANAPLENNAIYYWRVRPRIQGDGTPVAWPPASNFVVRLPAATPTPPAVTPSPTPTPVSGGPPALSGERFAFVSYRDGPAEIWVVRPDGRGLFDLSQNPASDDKPVWCKDGTKLAFVSDRDGNREIYVMNADGTNQVRLTTNNVLDDDPNWSPDCKKIVFISRRDTGIGQQIYVVNTDGTGVTRITNNTAANWNPMWSPDGTKILYGSSRNTNLDIFIANADGSGELDLTNNPAIEFDHAWSPDGIRITFRSSRDGNFEVYTMNADGTNQQNLTNHPSSDTTPIWSPDGRKIAFVSDRDGNQEVYIMNVDGTGQINVSNDAGEDCCPSWASDGTRLTLISKRDGNKQIYVVGVDGSGLKRVTNDRADDVSPVWAPLPVQRLLDEG